MFPHVIDKEFGQVFRGDCCKIKDNMAEFREPVDHIKHGVKPINKRETCDEIHGNMPLTAFRNW